MSAPGIDVIAASGTDSAWFNYMLQRSGVGFCGHCGNPGDECSCVEADPCECRDLHVMGSARLTPEERHKLGIVDVCDGQTTIEEEL